MHSSLLPQASPDNVQQVATACSDPSRTMSHPVVFIHRSDSGSMYHHWEDVAHLLMSLWLEPGFLREVQQQGLQVRLQD